MATSQNNTIDLSSLPGQARQEIIDYYEFLQQRYGSKKKRKNSAAAKLPDGFYHPLKVKKHLAFSREEIYGDE